MKDIPVEIVKSIVNSQCCWKIEHDDEVTIEQTG